MTSKKRGLDMTWDDEWFRNPEELWIFDNGCVDGDILFMRRHDRTHTRVARDRRPGPVDLPIRAVTFRIMTVLPDHARCN